MSEQEDWTRWLTEQERKVLARARAVLERSQAARYAWQRRSPARAKAILSAYRSLAALRALVAELQAGAIVECADGQRRYCRLCVSWYPKDAPQHEPECPRALKEADMRERLRASTEQVTG